MASTQSETKSTKKINVKAILGWLGWVIIYSMILMATGFYYGRTTQSKAQADTQAAVHAAVQAVTPAPLKN